MAVGQGSTGGRGWGRYGVLLVGRQLHSGRMVRSKVHVYRGVIELYGRGRWGALWRWGDVVGAGGVGQGAGIFTAAVILAARTAHLMGQETRLLLIQEAHLENDPQLLSRTCRAPLL